MWSHLRDNIIDRMKNKVIHNKIDIVLIKNKVREDRLRWYEYV